MDRHELTRNLTTWTDESLGELEEVRNDFFDSSEEERREFPHLVDSLGLIEATLLVARSGAAINGLTPMNELRAIDVEEERAMSLEVLRRNSEAIRKLEDMVATHHRVHVIRLRKLGASWRQIGEALGMTQQSIQEKAQRHGWTEDSDA